RSSIIVVASLISQKPNLAGICRTAEIMRAELLCLDDITVVKTAGFQSVSVSSEVWMPLHEVKEPSIKDFLREKKAEGYTIIALEQSSSSVVLGTYAFPEKCVLLLGREKEGVDADLLVEVDQVIEIPQYGYTRSLNVHVSASLLLYEYTKQ
ncbi:alpha/beta knot, partial [Saitoella complicata NRRL Y-17804]|uniref:alpha/beta knot n=1 Tax=Saitoella complicata (strain BCRC 22490 / CBS 7301 / JCM 7358 / NBRC 10748 / NRRL Y-17804) TaxID=698492 RepID=UPI000866DC57